MMGNISQRLFIALAFLLSIVVADVEFNTSTLSFPRVGLSAIEAGSKVYFIGGFEHGDLRATRTIEVYDLIAQNMSSPLQLDTPRAYVTPVVIEPNIYFVGGVDFQNPPFLYDPVLRQFIDYGPGPTVVTTQQISLHDSLLVVVGTSGADVLDVQQGEWRNTTALNSVLAELTSFSIFSKEGVVVVLGGVNVITGADSSSVWVYDITTGTVREYPDMLPTPFTTSTAFILSSFTGVIAIDIGSDTIMLYHVARQTWRQVAFISLYKVISLPDVTFLFNKTATRLTVFWNDTNSELKYSIVGTDFKHAFVSNNYAVLMARVSSGASMITAIYFPEEDLWVETSPGPVLEITRTLSLKSGWEVFSTTSNTVYGYNAALNIQYQVVDGTTGGFGVIEALIPAEETDQVYIFETGRVTKALFFPEGVSTPIIMQSCVISNPVARVGTDFLDTTGRVMSSLSWTQFTQHNVTASASTALFATDGQHFVLTSTLETSDTAKVDYNRVDIYNYITNEWGNSTDMPVELTEAFTVRWFYSAAALDNKLVVWMNTVMAVYDPSTSNWTTYTSYAQSSVNNEVQMQIASFVHLSVPTAQGMAFMRTNNNTLDVFSADMLPSWNSTIPAPAVEESSKYLFHQCLVRNDSQLFITSLITSTGDSSNRYNTLYIYDVRTGVWTYEQLPNALSTVPTIVLAGDYLLSMNNGILSFRDLINGGWYDQVLDFTFSPAVVLETSANLTFIAGGINPFNTYSNRIMIIPHSAITINPPVSNGTAPVVEQPIPFSGLSEAELIVAIAVPIGAVLIGAALLIFFLVRRQKRRRRQGGSSAMIGLANKYGQWFIPFESIKFGDQLGQGASGQVFKGTWKSTTVALKVSMTQANSSVISELELMMQLRPHPHVIQLFGFSVHPETDSIILVIEYCNGGSLDDILFDNKRQISMHQKLSWLLSMAKGIEHLHANNIVHRDIAARNVLLHQNEPKITDFGMSRLISEDKQRGTTKSELGPIRWMSPESLKSKEYSNKSDVWSFGALMFEVVAQTEPHAQADPIEIGRLIRDNGLTPTIPPSCPSELAQLMRECWHMAPNKRISIDKIVLQLEAMLTNNKH